MIKRSRSIEEMIIILQEMKGKTKLKFHQDFSNYYDEMFYLKEISCFELDFFRKDELTRYSFDY